MAVKQAAVSGPRQQTAAAPAAEAWNHGPVIAIGPLPPPVHGVTTAMEHVLGVGAECGIPIEPLDIADRRGLDNIGLLEWGNVKLGLQNVAELLGKLAARRPSIVFLFLSQGTLAFLRDFCFIAPARLTGRKVVIQLQGGYFRTFYDNSPWWLRALIRWSVGGADRVIILGEKFRGMFDGIVPAERVVVLPNAVEPEPYDRLYDSVHKRDDRPLVVFLATICKDKGALDVLEAMPEIRRRVPDVRVMMYGEVALPEDRIEIARLMKEHTLGGTVEFGGIVTGDDKARRLIEADVFVMPTRSRIGEGLPYVILEAMAAGRPIVTTDLGCIPETVTEGENAFMVSAGDTAAIADATVRLLEDAELRRRMGAANRQRIRERYTVRVWQRALGALFREVVRT